jgi:hypothetical protein
MVLQHLHKPTEAVCMSSHMQAAPVVLRSASPPSYDLASQLWPLETAACCRPCMTQFLYMTGPLLTLVSKAVLPSRAARVLLDATAAAAHALLIGTRTVATCEVLARAASRPVSCACAVRQQQLAC